MERVEAAWPAGIKRVVFAAVRVPEMSGGSTYVETMSEALAEEGIGVSHISLLPGTRPARFPTTVIFKRERLHAGPVMRSAGKSIARVWMLPVVAFKALDRRLSLRRYRLALESLGPDSVVIFTHVKAKISLRDSGFRRAPNGPLFLGQHHSSFDSLNFETWLREALPREFADVDGFTALTEEDARGFQDLIKVPCYGIGNPLPAGIRPGSNREPIAVALARYSVEKQLDVMIRAFVSATSIRELDHWKLHLYGEGYLQGYLQSTIDALGAGGRIKLMGRTDDVPGVLRRASLNLLTSRYEGFPMSILEAAAAGVPSVAFDCSSGVRGLVPPEAGYLVEADDAAAYAGQLRRAMLNDSERVRRGGGAMTVAGQYSGPLVVRRLGAILGSLTPPGIPAGAIKGWGASAKYTGTAQSIGNGE